MPENIEEEIQVLGLEKQLQKQENQTTSDGLLKDVSMQLLKLMKEITKNEITPSTVNAACNCASEIHKILKLNIDMKKFGM